MRSGKKGSTNKFMKIIATPVKVLCKARDFYVKSLTDYADNGLQRPMLIGGFGGGYSSSGSLSRSFSVNSSSYGCRDRLDQSSQPANRANSSTSTLSETYSRAELELYIEQHMKQQQQQSTVVKSSSKRVLPRSRSVGMGFMGRIDEEKPCAFSEDFL